jgi:hypothetical protein
VSIKFLYNGIKIDNGSLIPVYYSFGMNDNIMVKAKDFIIRLPFDIGGSKRKNDSDLESDYIILDKNNKYYKLALANFLTAEKKKLKRVQLAYQLEQSKKTIDKIEKLL